MLAFKTIKLQDGAHEKTFHIKKLGALEFYKTTNILLNMVSKTSEINPDIIKQFVFILLKTGNKVDGLEPEKVQDAVAKEMEVNIVGFIFDLIQSVLINIDQHDDKLLNCFIGCVFYQNHTQKTQLSIYQGEGDINNIIEDGVTIYKLMWEAFNYNYGKYVPFKKSDGAELPK